VSTVTVYLRSFSDACVICLTLLLIGAAEDLRKKICLDTDIPAHGVRYLLREVMDESCAICCLYVWSVGNLACNGGRVNCAFLHVLVYVSCWIGCYSQTYGLSVTPLNCIMLHYLEIPFFWDMSLRQCVSGSRRWDAGG
jgi:hypothetical protein